MPNDLVELEIHCTRGYLSLMYINTSIAQELASKNRFESIELIVHLMCQPAKEGTMRPKSLYLKGLLELHNHNQLLVSHHRTSFSTHPLPACPVTLQISPACTAAVGFLRFE